MKSALATLAALLASCILVPQAAAWGGVGHRTVAAIAKKLLPDKAADIDILIAAYLETDKTFVDAASYPDEWLREHDDDRHSHSPWHYVNWPDGARPYDPASCKPDCLLHQLPLQLAIIRQNTDPKVKAMAVAWVLHLVGDMHQPLHMSDRDDQGGNQFPVSYRGRAQYLASYDHKEHPMQLHVAWDEFLVEELAAGRSPERLADALTLGIATYKGRPEAEGDILSWAREAHQLATTVAYDHLTHGADLGDRYIKGDGGALATVQLQLLRAGIRLARLIDENYRMFAR